MKLSRALSPLEDLRFGLSVGFWPTLQAIFASPSLLLQPHALSRVYMSKIWIPFGDGTDESASAEKKRLITPHAHGVVLDLGAGHGHTLRYLEKARVTRYVALEPNKLMHSFIRAEADKFGFHEADGSLVILGCGAEDTRTILDGVGSQVDSVVSVLTLCTVPGPQKTLQALVRDVIKSGGELLMYEHVLNKRPDVAWWQRVWAPLWAVFFDGCRMDRPTDVWVQELGTQVEENGVTQRVSAWREIDMWGKAGEEEDHMFWHSVGRFVKA